MAGGASTPLISPGVAIVERLLDQRHSLFDREGVQGPDAPRSGRSANQQVHTTVTDLSGNAIQFTRSINGSISPEFGQ
jgi:hypothetical protein